MAKLKVYISSTFRDMEDARKHVIERIRNGLSDFFELSKVMEMMHGDYLNRPNIDFCLDEVRNADLYIILVGDRYGSFPDYYHDENKVKIANEDQLSYTEIEYLTAESTIENKLYGIYQFRITNDFFEANNLSAVSDLSDGVVKAKHSSFLDKLSEKNQMILINNDNDLINEINNKLAEFRLYHSELLKLEINEFQKTLINRQNQVGIINEKKNPVNILDKKLGQYSRCVVLVLNTIGKQDYYEGLNLRLKTEIINANDTTTFKVDDIMNRLASCAIDGENHYDRIFEVLMEACSNAILGSPASNLKFDNLYKEIVDKRVQNRFISIDIETDCAHDDKNKMCFEILSQFIQKIEKTLSENSFVYNFYFMINLKEKDISDDLIDCYYTGLKDRLPQIECINLSKLKLVETQDVRAWLDTIVASAKITKSTDEVFKFIFLKNHGEPKYYQDYIEQLETRTKK